MPVKWLSSVTPPPPPHPSSRDRRLPPSSPICPARTQAQVLLLVLWVLRPSYRWWWGVDLTWGGGVSRSPDGLFAQQEREPIRGRPAVRGKRTYGGRPGQRVEEQGTWASRTQKHSEAGYGRPVDRGAWTAKTVKRPWQQPAHPQYANYWAPLTRKRHTMPHSAQPQHTNYWVPRTRKRQEQEHRPQRRTESSDPTQHAEGRTSDCPGPRKGTTTRRNVTQGVDICSDRTPVALTPCDRPCLCAQGYSEWPRRWIRCMPSPSHPRPHPSRSPRLIPGPSCPHLSTPFCHPPPPLPGGVWPWCRFVCLWRRLLASRRAHSDPLWVRTCFGCVNGAPG